MLADDSPAPAPPERPQQTTPRPATDAAGLATKGACYSADAAGAAGVTDASAAANSSTPT